MDLNDRITSLNDSQGGLEAATAAEDQLINELNNGPFGQVLHGFSQEIPTEAHVHVLNNSSDGSLIVEADLCSEFRTSTTTSLTGIYCSKIELIHFNNQGGIEPLHQEVVGIHPLVARALAQAENSARLAEGSQAQPWTFADENAVRSCPPEPAAAVRPGRVIRPGSQRRLRLLRPLSELTTALPLALPVAGYLNRIELPTSSSGSAEE